MNRIDHVRPEFVELMPKPLLDGVVYISKKYATASHNCCCGCGTRIVTPLKPSGWTATVRNGEVTLNPSIGNWSASCRSHYWIRDGHIVWARTYSEQQIKANRLRDRQAVEQYYRERDTGGFWNRVWKWMMSWLE